MCACVCVVSGKVIGVNPLLETHDEEGLALLNTDPEGQGWICDVNVEDVSQLSSVHNANLLTAEEYAVLCLEEDQEEADDDADDADTAAARGTAPSSTMPSS